MLKTLSDEILVKRYQQGEMAAFEVLIQRHYQRIYRLAYINLIDVTNVSDVVQEVFIRALKGLKSFLFRSEATTWLYKITKNVCYEYNRKKAHKHVEAGEVLFEASPEDQMGVRQTIHEIKHLISDLPERQRDTVIFRFFEELSIAETAKIMKCRPGTVKANLHKAILSLRFKLKQKS